MVAGSGGAWQLGGLGERVQRGVIWASIQLYRLYNLCTLSCVHTADLEGFKVPQGGLLVFCGCMRSPNLAPLSIGKTRPQGGSSTRPPPVVFCFLVYSQESSSLKYPLWRTLHPENTNVGLKNEPPTKMDSIIVTSSRSALWIFTWIHCSSPNRNFMLSSFLPPPSCIPFSSML